MPSLFSDEYLHTIEAEGYHIRPKIRGVNGALAEWHEVRQKLHEPDKPLNLPSPTQMKQIIHIFSRIFFFGKLERIEFEWRPHLYRTIRPNTFGWTFPAEEDNEDTRYLYKIEIDPADLHVESNTPDHFTYLISILLHECVHAFLFMYSCCCEKCAHPRCQATSSQVVGLNKHGMAFLRILSFVEGYAQGKILDKMNTALCDSLEREVEEQGCFLTLDDVAYFHEDRRAEFQRIVRENMPGLAWIKTLQGMAGLPARLVDLMYHYYTK
ncbi:hypothetical protein PRZ48_005239 [Zasmidium cellare]|uniref:SprT-like domain-containing protein n=1 Tax=Zasmidium cellare TaxID=395010 RepID=A0ABR0EU16_ZASCE|nr:hypothetical protein PRZ48_005239 [Zasmidium cellare]